MLKAAQLKRCMTIAFGVRHLALLACLDETTVARTLRMLREESDPFIDWVAEHRGERADTYRLIVPQAYAEAAAWRRWAPGRLGGIHPVFRVLGGSAAFVYEALGTEPIRTFDLPGLTGLGATAVSEGLAALGEHGMAVRTRRGSWVRGPADPGVVADQLGVPETIAKIMKRYRSDREKYKIFLGIVEAAFPPEFKEDEPDFPDEVYAVLGPPEWMVLEPHGPPRR